MFKCSARKLPSPTGWCALAIFVLAFLMRLGYLAIYGGLDSQLYDSFGDQYIYLDLGRNLAAGNGFVVSGETWVARPGMPTSIFPPLYPIVVGVSFVVFGDSFVPLRLLNVLLSSIVAVVAYSMGRSLFGDVVGFISGVVVALYPTHIMYTRPLMSEGIFYPLVTSLVYLSILLVKDRCSLIWYAAWGVIAGLGVLTRSEVLFLVVLLALYIAYQNVRTGYPVLAPMLTGVLVALVVLSPYMVYNYVNHGRITFLPNAKWKLWDHTQWWELRRQPEWRNVELPERRFVPDWYSKSEVERDDYLGNSAIKWIVQNPTSFAIQRVQRLHFSYPILPREELNPPIGTKGRDLEPGGRKYGPTSLDDVVHYITPAEKLRVWLFRLAFLLALVGGIAILVKRLWIAVVVLIPLIWNIFHSMAFVGSERIRVQIDVFLFILSAYALVCIWSWVRTVLLRRFKADLLGAD
ncbi:MAG: glycosyltransferase family 39 protein [Anaerolineales bacterium]|nr:glycosyltransferase family 39 protein [Anaerolineales bacterium]